VCKQRVLTDEVDMLSVDLKVVDLFWWSWSWELAGDSFGFAVVRLNSLADRNELLTIHRPEQVVVGDADGF